MTQYFIHDGTAQQGPFDIKQLKELSINKSTPVWHEGLKEWTTAGKVAALAILFPTIPPPFQENVSTAPMSKVFAPKKQRSNSIAIILSIIGVVVLLGIIAVVNNNAGNGGSSAAGFKTYEEKVQTVEEIERENPVRFLDASGTYNQNIWGTKLKVHGIVKNTATVATYKDAVVRITYYSRTQTVLGNKDYTIYDVFSPHSEKSFELKIENYKDVESIGWDVVSAVAN